ncbi:IstB-like ATP-binding protein [Leptospira wolbachii serovar Codice str. CDC]|uniref:IstB-like ATP-binding protein n=3 Tax=Leptospiraceae TaxID=170 RepID=R9A517_9LEPT|nr:IstB-like ATP-binding protein [Leptospira wolbachii serovar Codice str. CDC]TGM52360.1 cell division protein ZapE [Leptospira vanthielii]
MEMNLSEITSIRDGNPQCKTCGGVGITLAEHVRGSRSGALVLCHCIGSDCNTCESKGQAPFMTFDRKLDKMLPCVCHNARFSLRNLENLVEKANIPARYRFQFLSTIDIGDTANDPDMSFIIAHDWANELVHKFKNPDFSPQGFYLWGGTGSGKTLLACVILNELIFRYGITCKYAKVNKDFLSAIRDTYQSDSETHGQERSIEKEFANVDVLIIDDFGVQKESEFNNRKLYDLIDSRYEQEKLTLLTSNHSLVEWRDRGQGRIYSRLMEMTKEIELKCPDYRTKFVKR